MSLVGAFAPCGKSETDISKPFPSAVDIRYARRGRDFATFRSLFVLADASHLCGARSCPFSMNDRHVLQQVMDSSDYRQEKDSCGQLTFIR